MRRGYPGKCRFGTPSANPRVVRGGFMRRPTSSSYNLLLAVLLTVAGAALVMAALTRHWNPNEMDAGVEGSLTAVALCPVFALLHGLSYRDTVMLCVPVLGVEYAVLRAANG